MTGIFIRHTLYSFKDMLILIYSIEWGTHYFRKGVSGLQSFRNHFSCKISFCNNVDMFPIFSCDEYTDILRIHLPGSFLNRCIHIDTFNWCRH